MVATPWGESDSLRDRRLRPGPGTPREDVERNQRERLYGAMVASLAKKGYEATTVADLTEVSGVSSRTFYDLFADKKACFLAALEAMIGAAVVYAARVGGDGGTVAGGGAVGAGGWEEQARAGFGSFAEMVVLQPAAARMGLIEAFAVGPEALAPLERAVEGFELLARRTLEQSPERAEMPAEMISAHVGAMREIASTRLWAGREAELPGLMDELWAMIQDYRPPPEPLRLAGRVPAARAESLAAHDHAERALRAFAVVAAEKGYAATTVDEVVKRAGMSATTFYGNFRGKEDALMAAIDSAGAQIVAAMVPAFRRATDWPHGMRAGFGALFNFLASRPALARLLAVEIYVAGPAAVARRAEALAPLEDLIAEGYERSPQTPRIATEVIAGGVYTLAYRTIRAKGPGALPTLAPLCTYIALSPFIGAEEACRVANGDGRGR
jgi:AcrR family transcriptional regulator